MKKLKDKIIRSRAVIAIITLAIANLIGFTFFFIVSHNEHYVLLTDQAIKESENSFNTIERNHTNMLSASLELLMTNKEIAESFYNRDKESLLKLCLPLLENLKTQNGITHWYFINKEPEKTCFLRVHNPSISGDKITRVTFERAIKSKELACGKELGKTAHAIRAVHPFYYKKKLIGYIELGIEFEHIFNKLKEFTGNHYGLIIKKEFLTKSKWKSVRKVKHLRNNWNDDNDFLLLYSTPLIDDLDNDITKTGFFNRILNNNVPLKKIKKDKKVFVRGIFPFYDILNRKVGGIYILKNVSSNLGIIESEISSFIILTIVFVGFVTFLMIFFHKKGERKLKDYRFKLEDLVEDRTKNLVEVNEKLEIEIEEHKRDQLALTRESEARNLAEIKHLQATQEVEKHSKMASVGVLAAGITHEINQPLNAIKVTADSIKYWNSKNKGVLPEIFVDQMSLISKGVTRISNIIKHMRDFWIDPKTIIDEKIDVNLVIKAAMNLTIEQMKSHKISKKLKLSPLPLFINCNTIHLEQIIINIVINAINALDRVDRDDKIIYIESREENGLGKILIKDNGPGLPTENSEELFDLFFSKGKKEGGMGLGLAIVKRYVEKYNGIIEAKNNTGKGASFLLSFPLHNKEKSE